MPNINISITNKRAALTGPISTIVCGNKDYIIDFKFDKEWAEHNTKTARFIFGGKYTDVVFTGSTCEAPALYGVDSVRVGVFAGDLRTTTPAKIRCVKSVLCDKGTPDEPGNSAYNQLLAKINKVEKELTDINADAIEEQVKEIVTQETDNLQPMVDEALQTESKTIVGAINEINEIASQPAVDEEVVKEIIAQETDNLQPMVDETLQTESKTIVGAINEINEIASQPAVDEEVVKEIIAQETDNLQPMTDEALRTESKTIIGAINELAAREDKQGLTEEEVNALIANISPVIIVED